MQLCVFKTRHLIVPAAPRAVAIRDTTRTVRSVVVGGGVEGIM